MAYQALYRQWRPSKFSEMVGQEGIVTALKNQVQSGRIAHAYLFCGTRGTGKTSTAKILAKAVNCENPQNGDPCGVCPSCKRISADESMDITEIDAASNNGVDQVRELRDTIQYPPQYGHYKVYIIDEVHMLSTAAFNALLKTLEEPPEYVVFILATTEPQKLPATILSRCQRFDFGRIPSEKIAGRLKEAASGAGVDTTDEALHMIARAAEGGMRDALSILDMCIGYAASVDAELVRQVLGTAGRSFLFRFCDALKMSDTSNALALIDELIRNGNEPAVFARDVSAHLRALMIALSCQNDLSNILEITPEDAVDYQNQASDFPMSRLLRMLDIFINLESNMRTMSMPRLALEAATIRCCLSAEANDVETLSSRIEELEQRCRDLAHQVADGTRVVTTSGKTKASDSSAKEIKQPTATRVASGDDKEIWKAVMDYLKKGNGTAAYSILTQGNFLGFVGNRYVWEASSNNGMMDMLNREKYRDMISKALTEVTGKESRFEAVAHGTLVEETAQTKEADDIVVMLESTFGKSNVLVQEKAKS